MALPLVFWPLAEHVSACGRRNKAPDAREKKPLVPRVQHVVTQFQLTYLKYVTCYHCLSFFDIPADRKIGFPLEMDFCVRVSATEIALPKYHLRGVLF